MMYMIFIIDHIHYLMNESKMLTFAYNSDRRVYVSVLCLMFVSVCQCFKEPHTRKG